MRKCTKPKSPPLYAVFMLLYIINLYAQPGNLIQYGKGVNLTLSSSIVYHTPCAHIHFALYPSTASRYINSKYIISIAQLEEVINLWLSYCHQYVCSLYNVLTGDKVHCFISNTICYDQ